MSNTNTEWGNDLIDVANPYDMNRHEVKSGHFRDARIYDEDINEPGWKIPKSSARSKYNKWVNGVRNETGWEGFKRAPRDVTEEFDGEDGKKYSVRKIIPYKVPGLPVQHPYVVGHPREIGRSKSTSTETHTNNSINQHAHQAGTNSSAPLLPQSRVKGANVDDEEFRAKMFTANMGREIARCRVANNMTQAELAKKINVDAATIKNIELGGLVCFNSEDKMVKELAKALGVASIKYHD